MTTEGEVRGPGRSKCRKQYTTRHWQGLAPFKFTEWRRCKFKCIASPCPNSGNCGAQTVVLLDQKKRTPMLYSQVTTTTKHNTINSFLASVSSLRDPQRENWLCIHFWNMYKDHSIPKGYYDSWHNIYDLSTWQSCNDLRAIYHPTFPQYYAGSIPKDSRTLHDDLIYLLLRSLPKLVLF